MAFDHGHVLYYHCNGYSSVVFSITSGSSCLDAICHIGFLPRAEEKQNLVVNETHDTVIEELRLIKEDLALAREQRDELEALMTALCVIIPKANKQ